MHERPLAKPHRQAMTAGKTHGGNGACGGAGWLAGGSLRRLAQMLWAVGTIAAGQREFPARLFASCNSGSGVAQLNHQAVMQRFVVELFIELLLERHGGDINILVLAEI